MLSCILQKKTIAFHKMAKSEATTFSGLKMIQTLTLQLLFRKRPRGLLRETLSFSFRNVMLQSEIQCSTMYVPILVTSVPAKLLIQTFSEK